ncbi:MAG TPA: hypothetical protein VF729_00540 [Solirubrobacterales bacterium]
MNLRLKTLGVGLLLAVAMSSSSSPPAPAETGGHFVSDAPNGFTYLQGVETESEFTRLYVLGGSIRCTTATYSELTAFATETVLNFLPTYEKCYYGAHEAGNTVNVTMNGCEYFFTFSKKPTSDNTVYLECPAGKKIELHVNSGGSSVCTLSIPTQVVKGGVAYTTFTFEGKHAITADVTVSEIFHERHGLCSLMGTNATNGQLSGSAVVLGSENGKYVNITAT